MNVTTPDASVFKPGALLGVIVGVGEGVGLTLTTPKQKLTFPQILPDGVGVFVIVGVKVFVGVDVMVFVIVAVTVFVGVATNVDVDV